MLRKFLHFLIIPQTKRVTLSNNPFENILNIILLFIKLSIFWIG